MIAAELYRRGRPVVMLERGSDVNPGAWARLQEAFARGIVGGTSTRTEIRVDVFLAELNALREVRNLYDQKVELGADLRAQLVSLAADRKAREEAISHRRDVAHDGLEEELAAAGFKVSRRG